MSHRKDSREIGVCHAYMNALYAHAQGKYTELNVLAQAISGDKYSSELIRRAAILEKLGEYFEQVWQASAFDLDPKSESETSCFIRDHVARAIVELTSAASEVEQLIALDPNKVKREQAAELIARLAYQGYSHEHYVKGLVKYGEVFELPEVSDRWRQHLLPCQQDIQNVHVLLSHLLGGETPLHDIHLGSTGEAVLLPGMLRAKVQDFLQLEGIRTGAWTFELVGISSEAAERWEQIQIAPASAGYWLAYGFDSQLASLWIDQGFTDPSFAASWALRNFTPSDALVWASAGIPPHQAESFRLGGISDPAQLNILH